jgi:hypothetical protein
MGPGGCLLTGSAAEMAQQIDALCDDTQAYQQLQQHGQAHALLFTDHQLQARLLELFHDLTTWG